MENELTYLEHFKGKVNTEFKTFPLCLSYLNDNKPEFIFDDSLDFRERFSSKDENKSISFGILSYGGLDFKAIKINYKNNIVTLISKRSMRILNSVFGINLK